MPSRWPPSVARVNALYAGATPRRRRRAGRRREARIRFACLARARRRRPASSGRPKRSLLGFYFRYAAIDGMTNPLFLEVILNPDLLPVERPEVLATSGPISRATPTNPRRTSWRG